MNQTIAIIGGTGKLGSGLALRWASAGDVVHIGSRDPERAREAADRVRSKLKRDVDLRAGSYADAAAQADIVVLTVPFDSQAGTIRSIRGALKSDAILVDTTVPLAASVGGSPTRTVIPWQGSAAQQAAELVPDGVRVIAALHNVAAECLNRWPQELDSDVLITGDDGDAKTVVAGLIERIPHLRAVDAGPLELARVTEQLTALLISVNRIHGARGVGIRLTALDPHPDGTHDDDTAR